jgi:hypothetical protein
MVFAENKEIKEFLCSLKGFRMLPKWISGKHTVADVSVSETDVVDKKCSLRHGLVDKDPSRSFWKVQGHSEHIKESNFNIYCIYRDINTGWSCDQMP